MTRDVNAKQPKLRAQVVQTRKKWQPQEGLVASAAQVSGKTTAQRLEQHSKMQADAWQGEAWNWLDLLGEYRYSVMWVGNLLSKATLQLTYNGDVIPFADPTPDEEPAGKVEGEDVQRVSSPPRRPAGVPDGLDPGAVLDEIYGGRSQHPEMLRNFGVHFTVAGEAYLLVHEDEEGNDEWLVIPAIDYKVREVNRKEVVGIADGLEFTDASVVRMWRPHPRHILKSDSPSRAVLPAIRQAYRADQHINSQLESRLTANGLMFIPNEVSIATNPTGSDSEGVTTPGNAAATPDDLIKLIIQTAEVAMANPDSPAAQIPVIVQVPGEFIKDISKIDFWSKLDEKAIEIRDRSIRRIALGMDMPPEVLEGTADLNHWSSWQVEEAAIKSHTEPLLAVIASALTIGILRPILAAAPYSIPAEELRKYAIGVDTSRLRLRPNRSKEALDLNQAGLLSDGATLRENGFEPEDGMDPQQKTIWLLHQLAKSTSATPQQLNAILRKLGIKLVIEPDDLLAGSTGGAEGDAEAKGPRDTRTSTRGTPERKLPEPVDPTPPALVAAGDLLVERALERLGSRVKGNLNRSTPGTPTRDIYRLLDVDDAELDASLRTAWSSVPAVAERYGSTATRPSQFQAQLDRYTRETVKSRQPHTQERFEAFMSTEAVSV